MTTYFIIDNLRVRIHFIIQRIWWTGLAPLLDSVFQVALYLPCEGRSKGRPAPHGAIRTRPVHLETRCKILSFTFLTESRPYAIRGDRYKPKTSYLEWAKKTTFVTLGTSATIFDSWEVSREVHVSPPLTDPSCTCPFGAIRARSVQVETRLVFQAHRLM